MKISYIWLGILALLLPFASAQVEDFNVNAASTLEAIQGVSLESQFIVTNTGTVASSYSLGVADTEAVAWVKMAPLSFALAPGQSQNVLLIVNVPSSVEPDTYTLETIFTTAFGSSYSVEQDIRVDAPMNLEMQSVPEKEINSCGTATYPITVKNIGPFAEEYSFSTSKNVKDIASFSKDTVVLASGDETTVTLTLKPSDCTFAGTKDFSVFGVAKTTEVEAELELSLVVNNAFIPVISVEDKRVNTDENTLNATITNTGSAKATYALAVEGSEFVSVSPRSVSIEAGEKTTVTITSRPSEGVEQKKYPLTFKAAVEGTEYSESFTLNVKNPTWIERNVKWVILGIILLVILLFIAGYAFNKWAAYTQTPEYIARQEEKAIERAAKEAQREEERKLKEAQRESDKKAREQQKLDAKLAKAREKGAQEAAAELKATHVLVSREKLQGDAVVRPSKSSWWIALVVVLLIAGVLLYGFRVQLLSNIEAVIAGLIALGIIIVLLVIYTLFFRAKKTTQEWAALKPRRENQLETGWRKGLGQLWIRVNELVPNAKVTVTGGSRNPAFVAPELDVYQYITITPEGFTADQVEKQRFMFRVARSWLTSHDVAEGNVKLMRSTPDGWKGIGTEKVRSDDKFVYYQAQSVGFEPFAIVGKSRIEKQESGIAPKGWLIILGILLILAALGGAWYFATVGQQETEGIPVSTQGIPPQTWEEDTRITVNLAEYFKDPDGDKLSYSYTPVENIVVTISGNRATLIPEKDWFGTRTITFTADDGKGGKVSSNKVDLTVTDVAEPTFWTNVLAGLEKYAGYIVFGVVLLVVLIAILEYRRRK